MKASLIKDCRNFLHSEDGAVTVDWVVLTAAVVGLGTIAGAVVWSKTGTATEHIATFIGERSVNTGVF
ncbi:MAG: hypothetical protein JXR35_11090 [Rhodobacteraceae bacterium]|jgi:hypothetical protein|nr:hypothetical protein [Paracoccaceae bacterium]